MVNLILFYIILSLLLISTVTFGIIWYKSNRERKSLFFKLFIGSLISAIGLAITPAMHDIIAGIGILVIMVSIIYIYMVSKGKATNVFLKYSMMSIVIGALFTVMGFCFKSYSQQGLDREAAITKSISDDANSSSSSKSKKEKESENDQKDLENANYLGYKYMLEDVPKNTNHVITKAYMDKDKNYNTTIFVNDQISSLSGSELKRYVKVVFDKVKKLEDGYEPNEKSGASRIIINDSSGNRLAHSSFFTRKIKYDFE
ncbi:hypothetical protein [Apilactobacillus xinyiensis]|uniref:hypothetical protein n=1 Tax=Apilactobacillus xinyiensis TaxID=2841032 RepID=UPI00200DBE9C|nr:hypothetical protein [Apilactobacillus xinyiensis]MCL0319403.1 hypothetical protein [Apilactobacillus xinyiensis]